MDLLRRGREGDPLQNKRVRTTAGSDVFNDLFSIQAKMRPLYKVRHFICFFFQIDWYC